MVGFCVKATRPQMDAMVDAMGFHYILIAMLAYMVFFNLVDC